MGYHQAYARWPTTGLSKCDRQPLTRCSLYAIDISVVDQMSTSKNNLVMTFCKNDMISIDWFAEKEVLKLEQLPNSSPEVDIVPPFRSSRFQSIRLTVEGRI